MRMTDVLLQVACGAAWSIPTVSTSGTAGTTDTTTPDRTFQSLLEERQSQLKDPATQDAPVSSGSQDENADVSVPQPKKEEATVPTVDLMSMGAALLAEGIPQMQSPEPPVAETVAEPLAVETVAPETTPMPETAPLSVPLMDQSAQPQVQQTAPLPQENMQTALPQTETVSAPAENTSSDTPSDTMASAAPRQQQDPIEAEVSDTAGVVETPLFQTMEHLPVKVGEAVTVDTTAPAEEMDANLGKALTQALKDGSQHLEIKLSPSNLGTVTAEFVRTPEGVLHVVLRAENDQAAKILNDHASTLGLLLQDSTHSEVRVDVPQPQQGQQLWQQPDQDGGQRQQQQQQQQQQPRQETESFLHQLRLGLLQTTSEAV